MLQAAVYMFTDIQIADRYSHAGQCYRNFHDRSRALSKWMKDVSMHNWHINCKGTIVYRKLTHQKEEEEVVFQSAAAEGMMSVKETSRFVSVLKCGHLSHRLLHYTSHRSAMFVLFFLTTCFDYNLLIIRLIQSY